MPVQPKVILFDVGNVVIDADQAITYKLLQDLGVPKEKAELFYSNSEYLEFSRGKINGHAFYSALANKYLQTPLNYQQIVDSHNRHMYGVNSSVLKIIQDLSQYTLAFATDTNEWQTAREKELIDLQLYGKSILRSHEIHKIKLDPRLFRYCSKVS